MENHIYAVKEYFIDLSVTVCDDGSDDIEEYINNNYVCFHKTQEGAENKVKDFLELEVINAKRRYGSGLYTSSDGKSFDPIIADEESKQKYAETCERIRNNITFFQGVEHKRYEVVPILLGD